MVSHLYECRTVNSSCFSRFIRGVARECKHGSTNLNQIMIVAMNCDGKHYAIRTVWHAAAAAAMDYIHYSMVYYTSWMSYIKRISAQKYTNIRCIGWNHGFSIRIVHCKYNTTNVVNMNVHSTPSIGSCMLCIDEMAMKGESKAKFWYIS